MHRLTRLIFRHLALILGLSLLLWAVYRHFKFGWLDHVGIEMAVGAVVLAIVNFTPPYIRNNLIGLGVLVMLVEVGFIFLESLGPDLTRKYREVNGDEFSKSEFAVHDDVLGYRPVANRVTDIQMFVNNNLIETSRHSIDSHGRRYSPTSREGSADKYLLFFGGSNAYSARVSDEESLPEQTASAVPPEAGRFRPYSYAFGGYGPQHMLARLQSEKLSKQVLESDGIAIYTYNEPHTRRTIPTLRELTVHRSPIYRIDDENRLVRVGLFNESNPLLYRLYTDILIPSRLLKFIDFDLPLWLRAADFELSCRIIVESRNLFSRQFDNDKFYVVTLGSAAVDIKRCLDGNGVAFIELDNLNLTPGEKLPRDVDGHPNGKGYAKIARLIVARIFGGENTPSLSSN